MAWLGQGGFATEFVGGATQTIINNFESAPIEIYPSLMALLGDTPAEATLGVVASTATDGNAGRIFAWDGQAWQETVATVTVNGNAGPTIQLDASDIPPTAARLWLSPQEQDSIVESVGRLNVAEANITTVQGVASQNQTDIANLQNEVTTFEADLTAVTNRVGVTETRLDGVEAVNTEQGSQINTINGTLGTHTSQIAALQAADEIHSDQIAALQLTDATLTARVTNAENATTALAVRVTNNEGEIADLVIANGVQDAAHDALVFRVETVEGEIVTLTASVNTINSIISAFPATYQARAEKDQAGGYVGLRADGTIDPNQLPPSVKVFRETNYVATIAERDALAANDPRPSIDGPWGEEQAGFAVAVADTGSGDAGFFVWNGSSFDDYSAAISFTDTDGLPEGSVNLYYTNTRVAQSPAVLDLVARADTTDAEQAAQGLLIAANADKNTEQDGRLDATESATATQAGLITANTDDILALDGRVDTLETDLDLAEQDIAAIQAEQITQNNAIAARLISFNGRTAPAVIPTAGDYNTDQVTNLSNLTGATTTAALNAAKVAIDDMAGTIISIDNKVSKGGDSGAALVVGTTTTHDLSLIANNATLLRLNQADGTVAMPTLPTNSLPTHYVSTDPATGKLHQTPGEVILAIDPDNPPIMQYINTTTLTITQGECVVRNGSDRRAWISTSAITKSLSPWAAGSGTGGRLPGTAFGLNATVYVFALMNADGVKEIGYDNNIDCTNKPGGFDWFKLIGAFQLLPSGAAHFRPFVMDKRGWVRCSTADSWPHDAHNIGAAWVNYAVQGLPLCKTEAKILATGGLPVGGGVYSIKVIGRDELSSVPSGWHWQSGNNADLSCHYNGELPEHITSDTEMTISTDQGTVKAYKDGSAYLGVNHYPTFRLRAYRVLPL